MDEKNQPRLAQFGSVCFRFEKNWSQRKWKARTNWVKLDQKRTNRARSRPNGVQGFKQEPNRTKSGKIVTKRQNGAKSRKTESLISTPLSMII